MVAGYRRRGADDVGLDAGAAPGAAVVDRRAEVESARAGAGGELPRFERYVVASVLVIYLPAVVDWVFLTVTSDVALRSALVAAGLVFFGTAFRVQTVDLGGTGVPSWVRVTHAVAGLAYVVVHLRAGLLRDLAPDDVPWLGAGSVLPLTMLALGIRWPLRRALAVLAAGLLIITGLLAAAGQRPLGLVASLLAVTGFSVFLLLMPRFSWWMLEVAWTLHGEREAAAELAITQERLRLARDLHDNYGRALAAVAMKSRLGAELARREDPAASAEIAAVERLAAEALDAVHAVAAGRERVDLATETAAAEAMLRSLGARVDLVGVARGLPRLDDRSAQALARVVREAATNIWRHSVPRQVTIGLTVADPAGGDGGPTATLRVRNDGLAPDVAGSARPAQGSGGGGSGLAGLAERLEPLGGSLTACRHGAAFVVEATVPVPPKPGRGAGFRRPVARRDESAREVGVGHPG